MYYFNELVMLLHLVGLSLGLGAATVKTIFLVKSRSDIEFLPVYLKITKPVTKLIILGTIVLTVTGIYWLISGYPFTPVLIVKIALVILMWILGPVIDNAVEPKLVRLAPQPGESPADGFLKVRKQHFALEIMATTLMYAITVVGVLL